MQVLCTLKNASESISGVAFRKVDGGMLSEQISAEKAELFLSIPGYKDASKARQSKQSSGARQNEAK
jgi:hypothetical protein